MQGDYLKRAECKSAAKKAAKIASRNVRCHCTAVTKRRSNQVSREWWARNSVYWRPQWKIYISEGWLIAKLEAGQLHL